MAVEASTAPAACLRARRDPEWWMARVGLGRHTDGKWRGGRLGLLIGVDRVAVSTRKIPASTGFIATASARPSPS
jgi:hypothetical protein